MVSERWSVFSSSTWERPTWAARAAALRPAGPDPTMAMRKVADTRRKPPLQSRHLSSLGLGSKPHHDAAVTRGDLARGKERVPPDSGTIGQASDAVHRAKYLLAPPGWHHSGRSGASQPLDVVPPRLRGCSCRLIPL